MPRITAFLQRTDPGRISSVSISPLDVPREMQTRKKVLPTHKGGSTEMYVEDCAGHPPGIATVPVVLNQLQEGKGWVELGVGRCCPLCWLIITPPEGSSLPAPRPVVRSPRTRKSRGSSAGSRKLNGSPRISRSDPATVVVDLVSKLPVGEPFTVYDAMAITGKGRTVTLKRLQLLVKLQQIKVLSVGAGRGSTTTYQKAP